MFLQSTKGRDQCKKYLERNLQVPVLADYKIDLYTMKGRLGKMFSLIPLHKPINLSALTSLLVEPKLMWFNFHNCESLENFVISSKISDHETTPVNNRCATASPATLAEKVQTICEHTLLNREGYHNWSSTSTRPEKTAAERASPQAQHSILPLQNHVPALNF